MKHLGDITKIKGCAVPVVDCVIGGSPCQDLSVAGKRAGLAGERSGLYMEQIRIIKEMRHNDELRGRTGESIRPRIWSGKMSLAPSAPTKEKTSQQSLKKQSKLSSKKLPMCLYLKKDGPQADASWETLGALPGEYSMHSFGESPKDAVESHLSQILEVNPHQRYCLSAKACQGILTRASRRGKQLPEMLRVALEKVIDMYNQQSTGEVSRTLKTPVGGDDIPVCYYSVENHPTDSMVNIDDRGRVPYTLKIRSGCMGGGKGALIQTDKSATLSTLQDQTLFQPVSVENHPVCGVDCRNATEYEEQTGSLQSSACHNNNSNNVVRVRYIVRRLTHLECERLQGYPDGWTDIGEWVDSKGKKHKEADSPRYKALGNSIAIPPWKWVLKRLCACYERDATMASLFDGIGGFPYIWEQLNGKGSCLWASEIEEFPMAVTKARFCE